MLTGPCVALPCAWAPTCSPAATMGGGSSGCLPSPVRSVMASPAAALLLLLAATPIPTDAAGNAATGVFIDPVDGDNTRGSGLQASSPLLRSVQHDAAAPAADKFLHAQLPWNPNKHPIPLAYEVAAQLNNTWSTAAQVIIDNAAELLGRHTAMKLDDESRRICMKNLVFYAD